MQDKYVCDIGDFGKYALLNSLCSQSKLGLSVIWYWVNPDDTDREHQKNDGKHISYLGLNGNKPNKKLQALNPGLFCLLQHFVSNNTRNIQSVVNSYLLGKTTVFYSASLSDASKSNNRKGWFQGALKIARKDDILFLDPDNGLASVSKDGGSILDAKHVLRSELKSFWENNHPIIVLYHHLNRSCHHDIQIKTLQREIHGMLHGSVVIPLRYRLGSSRAFFVIVRKNISTNCSNWLRDFVNPWPDSSFELISN